MILKDFLKMHDGGVACVSIQQMPYDNVTHRYTETYFEEETQDDVLASDMFLKIEDKEVDHFNIIGGGMYNVELCIYLEE